IAGARFTTTRIYQPSSAHLIVAEAPDFKAGIARLRSSLLLDHFELFTTLDQTIGALLERSAVNRFPVQLVGADLIVVVLIGLGLLTNNFLTAEEEQSKLWRIRGWSRLEIARIVGAQLLLLMVPALLAATLFAIAATWVQASRYGVDLQTTAADIATHLGPALVLTAVAVIGVCGAIAIGFSWRIVGQTRRATRARSGAVWRR